jgi:hypothetical protein
MSITSFLPFAFAGAILLQGASPSGAITAADVPKTQVASASSMQRLVANTGVALQWNWDAKPGKLNVTVRDGWLALKGDQRDAKGGRLTVDGVVTRIDERIFLFTGRIEIHDAEAKVDCVRDGEYTFRITGSRKFWRMKEQIAGCPGRADLTDYVDIYFK